MGKAKTGKAKAGHCQALVMQSVNHRHQVSPQYQALFQCLQLRAFQAQWAWLERVVHRLALRQFSQKVEVHRQQKAAPQTELDLNRSLSLRVLQQ